MNKVLILILLITGALLFNTKVEALEYTKSPIRAMLYSAVLPGGGQIYNHAYIKAAAVIGLQAFLIANAVNDNDKVNKYQDLMDNSSQADFLFYKVKRDSYKDDLRSDYWWIGTVLVLSVADAFVDAHLYNYNAEKNRIKIKFEDKLLRMEYRF